MQKTCIFPKTFTILAIPLKEQHIKKSCSQQGRLLNSCSTVARDYLPNYQLKQEVPILWSLKMVFWQKRKAVYIHADKYKISNFSTHCNFVSLITLPCLFVGATWEVCINDTNLRQVLLVIKETHLSMEEIGP